MRDEILANLDQPGQLERLYRKDKSAFKREFNALYPEFPDNNLVCFWKERLNFQNDEFFLGNRKDFTFVVTATLIAGSIAKLPDFFSGDKDFFYPRNIGFIIFPALWAFFAWKNKLSKVKIAFIAGITLIAAIFINSLPFGEKSDTLILSCIHLVLFLWSILGFTFVSELKNDAEKRMDFLKYNGDLLVITALFLIAGAIMTGITLNLFELIDLKIEKFYFEYVVAFGLPCVPILGTWLIRTNPQLVGKVSPVIAKIFSPLVLAMLVVYLTAIIYSGKDPYRDREFLLIFNALLIGVMAIIFFSIAESSGTKSLAEIWVLLLLSLVTIIVNAIALSAILFRIAEWGITPNRAAVFGSNVLILINLLLVTVRLAKIVSRRGKTTEVGNAIAGYLPVYFFWTILVTFLFPLIFNFK